MTLKEYLRGILHLGKDKVSEQEAIENIEAGVDFQGAKLWVLILAIFVASLGLNTNSTAVIIGAMLISPLMGPIIGMGLSVGINDFTLLKRAFRSYLTATLFSVGTAALYFLITPINEAQSELLARTSPTIYDVAIALCGGLAGIIALNSRSQRGGNVIPGVAIATALMPPLCTVGYGLATANWLYAAGALYLYLINTIFIALATFLGVAFIVRFPKKEFIDKEREKRVKRIITAISIITIIPSLFITAGIIQEEVFTKRCREYCQKELKIKGTRIISQEIDFPSHTLRVVMLGQEVDSTQIRTLHERLANYNLEDISLDIVQNATGIDEDYIRTVLSEEQKKDLASQNKIDEINNMMQAQAAVLDEYQKTGDLAQSLLPELNTLFPEVTSVSVARGRCSAIQDSTRTDNTVTIINIVTSKRISPSDKEKISSWLRERTGRQDIQMSISN